MALTLRMKGNFNITYLTRIVKIAPVILYIISSQAGAVTEEPPPAGSSESQDDYYFDSSLFKGSNFDQKAIEKLARPNSMLPGSYKFDVLLNGTLLGRYDATVVMRNGVAVPCFSPELIQTIGIKNIHENELITKTCWFLDELEPAAKVTIRPETFHLDITLPQSLLQVKPRGWISPQEYDYGTNIGFFNYLANYYHVSYSSSQITNQDSGWLSINGGINLGSWQYRQSGTANWNEQQGLTWNTLNGYLQRPIVPLKSEFKAGQLITSGNFFSGLNYSGVNLASSQAMLPDTMQGYAPVVRGVANSNAKVTIRQNGNQIYQTTVPAGPFELNDLNPTSNSGDLQVEIAEADGTVKRFSVPFSAVPESVRPGISRYDIALGQTRDMSTNTDFGDVTYQRGITNAFTAITGLRVASGYRAPVFGGVYASSLGAVGVDITFSQASVDDKKLKGSMTRVNWSKTFQDTGTTVSLASYHYSTSGYRDLSNILGLRESALTAGDYLQYQSSQKERFDVTLSQNMGDLGNIFMTAATQNYRDGRSRDTQYQLGYGKGFSSGVAMNLAVTRQRIGSYQNDARPENAVSLSISIPLFTQSRHPASLNASYNHSNSSGDQYQTSVSGALGEQQNTSYNLSSSYDQQSGSTTVGGGLQRRFPKTTLGVNASAGKNYWQFSGNAQGAVAVHSGGVTFGPYLADTFGLVEAKGAEGAQVFNSPQTTIDEHGYALIPAMTPYRYNSVSLSPAGMRGNAEILDSEKRVVPVYGSVPKISFRTKVGIAILIKLNTPADRSISMGTSVYDEKGQTVGMVSQNQQVYARVEKPEGKLHVEMDNNLECDFPYAVKASAEQDALVNLTASCEK